MNKNRDELYHYGVPGMKWGERKAQARQGIRDARKNFRQVKRQNRLNLGIGFKGIQKYENATNARRNAELKIIDAKAKYAGAKKKTKEKADRAEFNRYVKEMKKTGLPGSAADRRDRSKTLYNHLKAKKGKDYADRVAKKVQRKSIRAIIGGTAMLAGTAIAARYLNRR